MVSGEGAVPGSVMPALPPNPLKLDMKMPSASASTSEPMVKYSPRNRSIGTATISANTTATSPPARTDGYRPRPALAAASAVP